MRTPLLIAAAAVAGAAVLGTAVLSADARPNQHETFSVLATNANATPLVVGTGPIHALGKATQAGAKSLKLAFPDGSVIIDMKRQGKSSSTFDPKTCLHSVSEHGLWKTNKADHHYRGTIGVGQYTSKTRWVQCGNKAPVKVYISDMEIDGRIMN